MATRTVFALPQTTSIRHFLTRHEHRLPGAVSAVLVLVLAWLAGIFVWALIPTPGDGHWQVPPTVARTGPRPTAAVAQDPNVAGLFGITRDDGASASALATAPETQLNLKLFGILADREAPTRSRALVAAGNGATKPYALGQSVAPGVLLKAIFPDRIVLERNHRLETLRLDLKRLHQDTATDQPIAIAAPPANSGPRLSTVRRDLLSNPGAAGEFIRVQPVPASGADGQKGYRVYPGTNPAAFDKAGLRAGDLVTAINGVALSDPARALQALGQLRQAPRVSLTIQRDGHTRTADLDFTP